MPAAPSPDFPRRRGDHGRVLHRGRRTGPGGCIEQKRGGRRSLPARPCEGRGGGGSCLPGPRTPSREDPSAAPRMNPLGSGPRGLRPPRGRRSGERPATAGVCASPARGTSETHTPLSVPPREARTRVCTCSHIHPHKHTRRARRPKRRTEKASARPSSPASSVVPVSIPGAARPAEAAALRGRAAVSRAGRLRGEAPSPLYLPLPLPPPRGSWEPGAGGERRASSLPPARAPGRKLLAPGRPAPAPLPRPPGLTLRSRCSRKSRVLREGGREAAAGPQVSPRFPLLIQINKLRDGKPPPAPSSHPSPLARSALHLSFIFCLCFRLGRRRGRRGVGRGSPGPVPGRALRGCVPPSQPRRHPGGVNGGLAAPEPRKAAPLGAGAPRGAGVGGAPRAGSPAGAASPGRPPGPGSRRPRREGRRRGRGAGRAGDCSSQRLPSPRVPARSLRSRRGAGTQHFGVRSARQGAVVGGFRGSSPAPRGRRWGRGRGGRLTPGEEPGRGAQTDYTPRVGGVWLPELRSPRGGGPGSPGRRPEPGSGREPGSRASGH